MNLSDFPKSRGPKRSKRVKQKPMAEDRKVVLQIMGLKHWIR